MGLVNGVLPGGARALRERQLRVNHVQRWTPRFFTDLSGRLSDARFAGGVGVLGGAGLSAGWQPFEREELALSAGADAGFSVTDNPLFTASSRTFGGMLRAGYAKPVAFLKPGAFVGASTQYCASCVGLSDGLLTSVDGGLSLGTVGFERFDALAEYRLALVRAPEGRGGNRTEHHARLTGRVRLFERGEVTLLAGYDDGARDYLDVLAAGLSTLREQTFTAGAGGSVPVGRGTGALDLRHVRGNSALLASQIVAGPPPTARETTQVNATVLVPLHAVVDLSLGGLGSWTVLDGAPPLSTVAFTAGLNFRLGRISAQLSYQLTRSDTLNLVTTQHFLRLNLARPFEL